MPEASVLVGEYERVAHFVKLQAAENRRAVELGVLGEGAIGICWT
jgi:hypothetical protein